MTRLGDCDLIDAAFAWSADACCGFICVCDFSSNAHGAGPLNKQTTLEYIQYKNQVHNCIIISKSNLTM